MRPFNIKPQYFEQDPKTLDMNHMPEKHLSTQQTKYSQAVGVEFLGFKLFI